MRHLALRRPVIVGATAVVTAALLLNSAGREDTRIFPDALLGAMEQGTAPHILDVRTTKEYAAGHVPDAIHIPYRQLWQRHAELSAGKADLIVVYCSHGPRAGMTKLQLWAPPRLPKGRIPERPDVGLEARGFADADRS